MPIDPSFQKKREKVGEEEGIAVWGPVDPPERLGIRATNVARGTNVAVDWDVCMGCGVCLEVCPVQMYEWRETPGHPTSDKKPFPAKASECMCCYRCENECPPGAIWVTYGATSPLEELIFLLTFAQMIGGSVYGAIYGPYLGLEIPFYAGFVVLALGIMFILSSLIYFSRRGKPARGRGLMYTTVLVESGTYAVVRHPQFLGFLLLMSASILISQHWLAAIIGVPSMVWVYPRLLKKAEELLILRFGDDYKRYMQKVPRMNALAGIIRLLRQRKK